jgi:hypothetical protein
MLQYGTVKITLSFLQCTESDVIFMVFRFFTVRFTVKTWQLGCQQSTVKMTVIFVAASSGAAAWLLDI